VLVCFSADQTVDSKTEQSSHAEAEEERGNTRRREFCWRHDQGQRDIVVGASIESINHCLHLRIFKSIYVDTSQCSVPAVDFQDMACVDAE